MIAIIEALLKQEWINTANSPNAKDIHAALENIHKKLEESIFLYYSANLDINEIIEKMEEWDKAHAC